MILLDLQKCYIFVLQQVHLETFYHAIYSVRVCISHYMSYIICIQRKTNPGSSEVVPRNPLTRWDVKSIPANGIFFTKKLKNKNKNAQRVEND